MVSSAGAVVCQVCKLKTGTVTDSDPRAAKFLTTLKWGRNMKTVDGKSMLMEDFDFYRVQIVDKYGSKMGTKHWDTRKKGSPDTGCCRDDTYSRTVSGAWPKSCTDGCSFMVTPFQSKQVKTDKMPGNDEFLLPMGVMTAVFTDTAASATAVSVQTASFEMTVSDPAFLDSPAFESTMRASLASSIKGIDESMISNIVAVLVTRLRRLEELQRRLASKLKVTFDVLIPADYKGEPFKAESINVTTLASNIVKEAKAQGITITVSVAKVEVSTAIAAGDPAQPEQTGGATPMARLSAIFVALMTITGLHFLA